MKCGRRDCPEFDATAPTQCKEFGHFDTEGDCTEFVPEGKFKPSGVCTLCNGTGWDENGLFCKCLTSVPAFNELQEAARHLVLLRKVKQRDGKTPEYLARRDKAWYKLARLLMED